MTFSLRLWYFDGKNVLGIKFNQTSYKLKFDFSKYFYISDSKLLDFELLDYSTLNFQRPGLPEGLEFIQIK